MNGNLAHRIDEIASEQGWKRYVSAPSLVESWTLFADAFEDGFWASIYEFSNDRNLGSRQQIDVVLNDGAAQGCDSFNRFAESIDALDTRIRESAQPELMLRGAEYWWEELFPATPNGGIEDDMESSTITRPSDHDR